MLLTHLYEFFGSLLSCSEIGMAGFSAYMGDSSMYEVHKYVISLSGPTLHPHR